MTRRKLFPATVAGVVFGAIIFGAPSARASGFPVVDVLVNGTIELLQKAVTNAIQGMSDLLDGDLHQSTQQISANIRGSVAAQQQIVDASNASMATFLRNMRNAQIAANHVVTPETCQELQGGQSVVVSALQADTVGRSLAAGSDPRGEAGPQTPAWEGGAQAAAARLAVHWARYCNAADAEAGLCGVAGMPNADQRASSLDGALTYADTQHITAANDYKLSLLQPVPPPALRGDPRKTPEGTQGEMDRQQYNAQISLAQSHLNDVIAKHAAAVNLTAEQQREMAREGKTPVSVASWMEAVELEANRRYGSPGWAAGLERMPSTDTLMRELIREQAFVAYMQVKQYELDQRRASMEAALLADQARVLVSKPLPARPPSGMPTPQVASQ